MSVSYTEILEEIELLTDEELERNLTRILQGWPNTYTFSKALSEEMVSNEKGELPVSIFRPSAVISTVHEPVRGYTDNLYGPLGLMLGGMLGIIHCFPGCRDLAQDMVPVDYTVNCLIVIAYITAQTRNGDALPVYNFTSSPHNTNGLSWKALHATAESLFHYAPFSQAIWSVSFIIVESVLLDRIGHFFLHQIPGMVLDKIAVITGRKPMLSKIYKRIQIVKKPLRFFAFNIWEFETENISKLRESLNEEDNKLFYFDVRDINYNEGLGTGKLGLRYYYLKEKMETLTAAESKAKWLLWVHRAVKLMSGLALLKICVISAHILPI